MCPAGPLDVPLVLGLELIGRTCSRLVCSLRVGQLCSVPYDILQEMGAVYKMRRATLQHSSLSGSQAASTPRAPSRRRARRPLKRCGREGQPPIIVRRARCRAAPGSWPIAAGVSGAVFSRLPGACPSGVRQWFQYVSTRRISANRRCPHESAGRRSQNYFPVSIAFQSDCRARRSRPRSPLVLCATTVKATGIGPAKTVRTGTPGDVGKWSRSPV